MDGIYLYSLHNADLYISLALLVVPVAWFKIAIGKVYDIFSSRARPTPDVYQQISSPVGRLDEDV